MKRALIRAMPRPWLLAVLLSTVVFGASAAVAVPHARAAENVIFSAHGKHFVQAKNTTDNTLDFEGHIQLNQWTSSAPAPDNRAIAWSSCHACQSLAVALQINLVKFNSTVYLRQWAMTMSPGCVRCMTVALALQYNFVVADPTRLPAEVKVLIARFNTEFAAITADTPTLTLAQAVSRINGVVREFVDLTKNLATYESATVVTPR